MTEPKLCETIHKRVDERLDTHDIRLNNHSDEIDELKQSDAVNTTIISQLCKSLSALTTAMWALVLTVIGGLVGFFFYTVQSGIFNK